MNCWCRGVASVVLCFPLICASQIRVMSYNLLNFPTGNIQGRVDTLEKIVDHFEPHLLMIQELKSAEGLEDATEMMNGLGYSQFSHSAFVPQQSDPGSPYKLQQALIYSSDIFTLKSQAEITTDVRDFNEFVLYINDAGLAGGSDTTFLYVYVTHLKSSEGNENQQLRLAMVNDWLSYMDSNRNPDDNVILAGDFNLYSNSEDAYEALVDEDNTVVMHDVFSSFGNWSGSSFNHKEILTQSTRVSQVAGDGAGGGLDDRFDFILFSGSMMNPGNVLSFVPDSFRSLGNTGECYNDNITDCNEDNEVPYDVLRAMYYMSDHIPQVCELNLDLSLGLQTNDEDQSLCYVSTTDRGMLAHLRSDRPISGAWSVLDFSGRTAFAARASMAGARLDIDLPVSSLSPGAYLFVFACNDGRRFVSRFVISA